MVTKTSLKRQIIESRIEDISKSYNISKEEAFSRFCFSIFTFSDFDDYDYDDTDGCHEHQIDLININDSNKDCLILNIFQFKYKTSFESGIIKQMKYGIDFVINSSKNDLNKNLNKPFVDKIKDFRELRKTYGDINIEINVYYITLGNENIVSQEYQDVEDNIIKTYNVNIFKKFNFYTIGENKIIDRINAIERKDNIINERMSYIQNLSVPSFIQYLITDTKGVVLTVKGLEVARIVDKYYDQAIFDRNVRDFLGTSSNPVNKEIYQSCINNSTSKNFWFLNNGITIVCSKFSLNTDPEAPSIDLTDMQIINGCQTSMVLRKAMLDGKLDSNVNIIARIIETEDQEMISSIVQATNNQTLISNRDLKSNDPIQKEIEKAIKQYGYNLIRKVNPLPSIDSNKAEENVSNEIIAQSFLAVCLKKPSKARHSKANLWLEETYHKIFDGGNIERYVIAYLLYSEANTYIRKQIKKSKPSFYKRIGRYVVFHVARIAAFDIMDNDDWSKIDYQKKIICDIKSNKDMLKPYFDLALDFISQLINDENIDSEDIVNYTKKDVFDDNINKRLYYPKK